MHAVWICIPPAYIFYLFENELIEFVMKVVTSLFNTFADIFKSIDKRTGKIPREIVVGPAGF